MPYNVTCRARPAPNHSVSSTLDVTVPSYHAIFSSLQLLPNSTSFPSPSFYTTDMIPKIIYASASRRDDGGKRRHRDDTASSEYVRENTFVASVAELRSLGSSATTHAVRIDGELPCLEEDANSARETDAPR
ncbi:hypothetical protein PISMIDRAFT_673307 [Pisolithus microcarpus 441]|uniref:Uncharacterized protein n=1 Tax=Pisolithus microcarpus 441 TaxID=765257 RepID=A0A0D0A3P0_9AGAM|nr:hypothetical protein PISMIDRAFT_673307 [Pisolithus microcarpus 441]